MREDDSLGASELTPVWDHEMKGRERVLPIFTPWPAPAERTISLEKHVMPSMGCVFRCGSWFVARVFWTDW